MKKKKILQKSRFLIKNKMILIFEANCQSVKYSFSSNGLLKIVGLSV